MSFTRRDFFKIMGVSAIGTQISASAIAAAIRNDPGITFKGIAPDFSDRLITADGIVAKVLIREGDSIGKNLKFGANNDHIQFFELTGPRHGILWVNHEYYHLLLSGKPERTLENVTNEMDLVGGSLVELRYNQNGWYVVPDSIYNRRITGKTEIPFAAGAEIKGRKSATGTLSNCAGGRTPWGNVLTCEENYDGFYGESDRKTGKHIPSEFQCWDKFYPQNPPEHYGWVVEINPKTGEAKKHTSMGRFMHECATVRVARDGRPVIYTGDDTNDEHLYKFISDKKDSLETGTLYVANIEKGQWIPLVHSDPRLKSVFKDQLEVLTYCREASKLVGATPLDRPEDIEIDPFKGHVLIAMTNNKPKGRPFGHILKLTEKGNDPRSLTFKTETFLSGGEAGGFSSPDNMVFDKVGNLWFTTDISGYEMHKGPQQNFGNNGLFVVMRIGPMAGIPVQVASAPIDAEFTGPFFSPDYKTLFLSVQHPGELTTDLSKPTSHWPDGGLPRSSVVTLSGPLLERITGA